MNIKGLEAVSQADRERFAQRGLVMDSATHYITRDAHDNIAMDAQPGLVTTTSSGIPFYLSNFIDPKLIRVLFAPNKAAQILGEEKKGDWTMNSATFPIIEHTGEVSSYGDYSENGSANYNANFPMRQSYHYQTITQWGEREEEMSALARINNAAEKNLASIVVLNKFQNNTYFYGVSGLQLYGLLNDPSLLPPSAPVPKAYNSNASGPWITNGVVTATANEVYQDIQTLFVDLVQQSDGLVEMDTKMVLALSPASSVALTATNSYNVNVSDLLKKNFPNLRIETAIQYANTAAGNLVQLIAESIDGQKTATTAFTEKLRAHRIIPAMTAFKQKKSQGTWGTIIWMPFAIAQLVGV